MQVVEWQIHTPLQTYTTSSNGVSLVGTVEEDKKDYTVAADSEKHRHLSWLPQSSIIDHFLSIYTSMFKQH
jgi:hypothetical protein